VNPDPTAAPEPAADVHALSRPGPKLLTYYTLCCVPILLFPPAAVAAWLVNYFRFRTLTYRFDQEGVSMRWGILFRREVLLNYGRIQDIHLVSNFLERWLGLARIQIQTASGSSTPEMTIEGFHEFEAIRDFLYGRMRGTREQVRPKETRPPPPSPAPGAPDAELAGVLREVAAELRAVRAALAERRTP
jgi:uncharacterized protein